MKKIKDERLILQNLKNIRIAYIVQTIGLIGILVHAFISKGTDALFSNPAWLVLLITAIVSMYLHQSISVDYESDDKSPKKSLIISIVVVVIIAIVVGIFVNKSQADGVFDGLMTGGIILISGLIPSIYLYKLRLKKLQDFED